MIMSSKKKKEEKASVPNKDNKKDKEHVGSDETSKNSISFKKRLLRKLRKRSSSDVIVVDNNTKGEPVEHNHKKGSDLEINNNSNDENSGNSNSNISVKVINLSESTSIAPSPLNEHNITSVLCGSALLEERDTTRESADNKDNCNNIKESEQDNNNDSNECDILFPATVSFLQQRQSTFPSLITRHPSYFVEHYLGGMGPGKSLSQVMEEATTELDVSSKEINKSVGGMPLMRMNSVPVKIEFTENDHMVYAKNFLHREHENFLGEDESKRVVAVSIMKSSKSTDLDQFKALIRTEQKDEQLEISKKCKPERRSLSRHELMSILKPRFSLRNLVKADFPKVKENLVILEKAQYVKQYKFGVIYCAPGQASENDIFANLSGSKHWDDFLELLGTKIELKGWPKFAGGLDVKRDATGTHSIFTDWKNYQVMFHVSTMLPFSASDPQQLERKRHIGNDVVTIIFKEPDTIYNPATITSHFNHVVIVVEPFVFNEQTFYRVESASKSGVPYFGPRIIQPLYKKDEYFRDFLLTKMINGERAAYHAPEFKPRITRTRSQILQNCVDVVKTGFHKERSNTVTEMPNNRKKAASFIGQPPSFDPNNNRLKTNSAIPRVGSVGSPKKPNPKKLSISFLKKKSSIQELK